ncbi:MAG: transglycosylase domain-containing protein [Cyanosarcina radialis HA8281-LM2]|jgi:membrane peptidoglycan carboxypeptidase|nr:transglycosylase domain-containing protein [Cyanosarcina radialis HA8281-LM2]
MSSSPPPRQSPTILGQITQAVHTIQAKANFSQLRLNPNARVPEIKIVDANPSQPEVYPLLGDRYLVGRSSKSCDIVVRNPVVSQVHFSLNREGKKGRSFSIQDENSTNGIFLGRRRIKSFPLRHGDTFTLGPPELASIVKVKYHDPPPWYVKLFRYTCYGVGTGAALLVSAIALEASKVQIGPIRDQSGPVVIFSREFETPLRQPRTQAHREMERLNDFSPSLPKMLLASEDARFYWHFGIDPVGILRALRVNTREGESQQGASTLTQQMARSLFPDYVGRDKSVVRKLKEAVVALKLETFYSKDQLLLLYLNRVFLGENAYGFEDAAQFYFGKSAKDINLSESAALVGILPAPNAFNPCANADKALERRNLVLRRGLELGFITQDEERDARRSRIAVRPEACQEVSNAKAPYFFTYAREELRQILGDEFINEGNLFVETTIDMGIQQKAEASFRNTLRTRGKEVRFSQGALVTLDSSSGEIRAMIGGTDTKIGQFNRAIQAQRQPGSTFKLFSYTSAIERGISPGKQYSCAPLTWRGKTYKPCERVGAGSTDLATGLAQSENVIALRIAQDVGLRRVVEMAERLGVKSPLEAVPGLVIGQSSVNVLEMTSAYGAIADRGTWHRPHAIRRIYDSSQCRDRTKPQTCRLIYSAEDERGASKKVLDSGVADTMINLLQGVVQRGTAGRADVGQGDEGGKTGTTDRGVDLWYVGFIPNRKLVTGIWLGNDNNSPTQSTSGEAVRLWGDYMGAVVNNRRRVFRQTSRSESSRDEQPQQEQQQQQQQQQQAQPERQQQPRRLRRSRIRQPEALRRLRRRAF